MRLLRGEDGLGLGQWAGPRAGLQVLYRKGGAAATKSKPISA